MHRTALVLAAVLTSAGLAMAAPISFSADPSLSVTGSGNTRTVAGVVQIQSNAGSVSYRATDQGGVSEAGFGVALPNDTGVSASRGLDGDGANGVSVEQLTITFLDPSFEANFAKVVLGVNRNDGNLPGPSYKIEAFLGMTSVGSVTGDLTGGPNSLLTVPLDFSGSDFDRIVISNTNQNGDSFVLSGLTAEVVPEPLSLVTFGATVAAAVVFRRRLRKAAI